jgi:hypothetical protein
MCATWQGPLQEAHVSSAESISFVQAVLHSTPTGVQLELYLKRSSTCPLQKASPKLCYIPSPGCAVGIVSQKE